MEKRIMVKRSSFGLTIVFLMNIMVGQSVSKFGSMTNDRLGTTAAMELLIPVGARDMAMGGAGIATSTGLESIYWNPAGLGRIKGKASGLFSNMNYIADIGVNYGAVGLNFGKSGVFAFSAKAVDYGRILLTTVDDPEGIAGRTFTPNFLNLGFSYARPFTASITCSLRAMILSIGATPFGQTSTHFRHLVQSHTPPYLLRFAKRSDAVSSLGSLTNLYDLAKAAGPRKLESTSITVQSETQAPHSMQETTPAK